MTESAIKSKIVEDMKEAMRSHDKESLAAIRLILAAFKQREVDERITLTDEHVLSILDKMLKQRRESITQYQAGNRADLVHKEEEEIRIIQRYLPTPLSDEEVNELINAAIKESNAASMRDMGKVMAILKPKLQGRADMAKVSTKIKEHLPV